MAISPNTIIAGRYRIVRSLGSGTQGEVYQVEDLHQRQVVALKFLGGLSLGAWHEAQVLTGLRGDYILPVHNADVASGVPYIVTNLARHGTLKDKTPPTGLSIDEAVRYVRHACRGVARTHDAGLLHRDIKPDNIFLNERDMALLGDFGLSHLMDARKRAPFAGTPTTMSPEVAAYGDCTVASDIYSLGATLYYLLAGDDPHPVTAGITQQDYLRLVATTPPPRIRDVAPHVSQGLASCVETAMAWSPDDRHNDAAALDRALGDLPSRRRDWRRSDEHGGHHGCWRGEHRRKRAVVTCAISGAGRRGTSFTVETRTADTGRRIGRACRDTVPPGQLHRVLRACMAAVD